MNLIERMKQLTLRRWIGMVVGNVILAIDICILKWSGTGNDPYTGMNMALAELLGVIVISFACSVYQTADAGISPYGSLAIIGEERTPIPYFWCRMFCDGLCALICFLSHGVVGIGMLLYAFALGPVIAFFNRFFSVPVLLGKNKKVSE